MPAFLLQIPSGFNPSPAIFNLHVISVPILKEEENEVREEEGIIEKPVLPVDLQARPGQSEAPHTPLCLEYASHWPF